MFIFSFIFCIINIEQGVDKMGFFKKQLINVIEWTETNPNVMVYRFPVEGKEIKNGAQLTVRASQVAIFVNEGQIADVFTEGRYQLTTANIPVLTKLNSWKYNFNSPFKAEVYFVNTRQFTNLKWGTSNPIIKRDVEFNMVRIRAYGNYAIKVDKADVFLREVFGTLPTYETKGIVDHIKSIVVSCFSDFLAETKMSVLDISTMYEEIGEAVTKKVSEKISEYGLKTTGIIVENISLPEEVEKAIDTRSRMGAIGDVNAYTRFQAADAIKDAAKNEGGVAGMGVGLGAGVGFGKIMTDTMSTAAATPERMVVCPHCNHQNPEKTKFCSECGKPIAVEMVACINCHAQIKKGSKFCPECGAKQEISDIVCPKCNHKVKAGTKFCPECGEPLK